MQRVRLEAGRGADVEVPAFETEAAVVDAVGVGDQRETGGLQRVVRARRCRAKDRAIAKGQAQDRPAQCRVDLGAPVAGGVGRLLV